MNERGKTPYHHGDLREALLVAAEEELKEKGVEGFTLRGCAKRAGVSHAAPAHHFRDADGLLTALAAVAFTRFTAAMTARQSAAPADPRERLIALGLGYIDFATSEPALFRLMFASGRPDFDDAELQQVAMHSLGLLIQGVNAVRGGGSPGEKAAMLDSARSSSGMTGMSPSRTVGSPAARARRIIWSAPSDQRASASRASVPAGRSTFSTVVGKFGSV